jgi:hypothetical protein
MYSASTKTLHTRSTECYKPKSQSTQGAGTPNRVVYRSLLSPGQGWHRRETHRNATKAPLTGNRSTKPPPAALLSRFLEREHLARLEPLVTRLLANPSPQNSTWLSRLLENACPLSYAWMSSVPGRMRAPLDSAAVLLGIRARLFLSAFPKGASRAACRPAVVEATAGPALRSVSHAMRCLVCVVMNKFI